MQGCSRGAWLLMCFPSDPKMSYFGVIDGVSIASINRNVRKKRVRDRLARSNFCWSFFETSYYLIGTVMALYYLLF